MYTIAYNTQTKSYSTKADALRNAAVLSKVNKCVVKVYGPYNEFIKSFDGR
jgi:hypothetical protein